jgi:anti-anti-sigma regulatory factor
MNITTEQREGRVPVTVLSIHGDLDGSNYHDLIAKTQAVYQAGVRHLLFDLTDMPYMSSAGLVALHIAVLLLRGDRLPDLESGWNALKAIDRDQIAGTTVQSAVKLLNPQPRVARALEISGMNAFFEVHADLAAAVASF